MPRLALRRPDLSWTSTAQSELGLTRDVAGDFWDRLSRPTLAELIWLGGLGAAAIVVCVAAYALRNVWVGDAAVYLPYAQHVADGHFFQFNLGQFSSGATSPLWGVLLGIPYLFGLGLAGAKIFALIFALGAVAFVWVAAAEFGGSAVAAAIASLFVVAAMTWYALVLYESGLVVVAVSGSLIMTGRVLKRSEGSPDLPLRSLASLILIWAALPLVRPDATVVVVAEAVGLVMAGPWRRARAAQVTALALVVAAVPALAYYGYSAVHVGTFSTSASERSFALHEVAPHWLGPLYLSWDALHQLFGTFWVLVTVPGLAGLGLLARKRETRWLGLVGGAVFLAYLFLLTFISPGATDTPRYLLPVIPLLVIGTARCLSSFRAPRTGLAVLGLSAVLIGGLGLRDLHHRVVWLRSLGLTTNEVFERDVVSQINRLAHPGDTVLAYEVQLRYYLRHDVSVLSEDGITDAKVRPYQSPARMAIFLRRYRPDWWIADANAATRPYMRGSVLDRAFTTFKADRSLRAETIGGIRFTLVARRSRPLAPGFGGWQMLFRLAYGG